MAFKMKSGNKVSFKNMGSSPVKQLGDETMRETVDIPSVIWKDGKLVSNPKYKRNIGLEIRNARDTSDNAANGNKDEDINKYKTPEEIAAGDKKSEWGFDPMVALKTFLSSKDVLGAAGAGMTKKSPNEILAEKKAKEAKRKRKADERAKIKAASNLDTDITE